jgi:hypothetical protein
MGRLVFAPKDSKSRPPIGLTHAIRDRALSDMGVRPVSETVSKGLLALRVAAQTNRTWVSFGQTRRASLGC